MGFLELFLIGVGLSMDAFAVSVCRGLAMPRMDWRQGALAALFFGGFQALMPLAGWGLGRQFEQYITSIDHWIAFLLLGYIGGKMVWDAFHDDEACCQTGFALKELLMMAIATSIDALAVGVSLTAAGLGQTPGTALNIWQAAAIIAACTFSLCLLAVQLGRFCGRRLADKAGLAGGLILIGIGLKMLT